MAYPLISEGREAINQGGYNNVQHQDRDNHKE